MPLFELLKSIIYFNVAQYSKSIHKDINTKLELFAHHDKYAVERHNKDHKYESYIFELCPFLTKPFK